MTFWMILAYDDNENNDASDYVINNGSTNLNNDIDNNRNNNNNANSNRHCTW